MTFNQTEIRMALGTLNRAVTLLTMADGAILMKDDGAAQVYAREAIAEIRQAADALGMELIEFGPENYR